MGNNRITEIRNFGWLVLFLAKEVLHHIVDLLFKNRRTGEKIGG